MPTRSELVAAHRSEDEIRSLIGADALIYQDVDALRRAVGTLNPSITQFEGSCFDGHYVTGDVTPAYLDALEAARKAPKAVQSSESGDRSPLSLKAANLD
jgi:amidophosphoribosyltransferase